MKLFHVSDLHIRTDMENNKVVKDKLKLANSLMHEGDRLILTGDIVDDGKEEQYKHAFDLLGVFRDRIILIPGNHDFGSEGIIYEKACEDRYNKLVKDLGSPSTSVSGNVGVIVLDSNMRWLRFFAEGEVGFVQRTKLGLTLSAFKRKNLYTVVALHHSPFDHDIGMKLRDHDEFLTKVYGKADLVLFGHTHHRDSYRWPKTGEKPPLTRLECAGALFYEDTEILTFEVGTKA